MLASLPWLHWWLPQALISAALWLWLGPAVGRVVVQRLGFTATKPSVLTDLEGLLSSIVGSATMLVLASFLVALHRWGLPLLFLILVAVALATRASCSPVCFHWTDALAVFPVAFILVLAPVSIDTATTSIQLSLFHDRWPLDTLMTLDSHYGLSSLLYYWFDHVPLQDNLAVQGVFFALLSWWVMKFCFLSVKKAKPSNMTWWLFVMMYWGSLYFRKQIHVKASAVSGLFMLVAGFMLAAADFEAAPALLGLVMACAMIFGEYGIIVLAGMGVFLLIAPREPRRKYLEAVPWVFVFGAPELIRKGVELALVSHHAPAAGAAAAAIFCAAMAGLAFKMKSTLEKWPTFQRSDTIILVVSALLAAFLSFWPLSTAAAGEGGAFNVFRWSVGREGFLFLVTLVFLFRTSTSGLRPVFFALLSTQFLFFIFWRLHNISGASLFDPNQLWWNLHKDAVMITFPLVVTVCAALAIDQWMTKPVAIMALAFALILLQDPLVTRVGDGPFSPYAPRLSALDGLRELLWQGFHKRAVASRSGNIVLPHLALAEPEAIEQLFLRQKEAETRLKVCLGDYPSRNDVADFDIAAYTVEYPTGAEALTGRSEHCDVRLIPGALLPSP